MKVCGFIKYLLISFLLLSWPVFTAYGQSPEEAHAHYEAGEYQKAAEAFDLILAQIDSGEIDSEPTEFALIHFFAASSHFRIQGYDKALSLFTVAQKEFENLSSINEQWLLWAWQGKGLSQKKLELYENAASTFGDLVEFVENKWSRDHPAWTEFSLNLAKVLSQSGQSQDAAEQFRKIFDAVQSNPEAGSDIKLGVLRDWLDLVSNPDEPEAGIKIRRNIIEVLVVGGEEYRERAAFEWSLLGHEYVLSGDTQHAFDAFFHSARITQTFSGLNAEIYRERLRTFYRHLMKVRVSEVEIEEFSSEIFDLWYDYANLRNLEGEHTEAAEILMELGKEIEQSYGKEHPDYGYVLNQAAVFYNSAGKYERAARLLEKAIEAYRLHEDLDPADLEQVKWNLTHVLRESGRFEAGAAAAKALLDLRLRYYGENHVRTAYVFNDLARFYDQMEQIRDAEVNYIKALENYGTLDDANPENHLIMIDNLLLMYERYQRTDDQIEWKKTKTELLEEIYEESSTEVLNSRQKLAHLYLLNGDYGAALRLLGDLVELEILQSEELGNIKAGIYNDMAGAYRFQGNLDMAESYYHKSGELRAGQTGRVHPDIASNLSNLAGIYILKNKPEKAIAQLQEAKAIVRQTVGEDDPDYASTLNSLAQVYFRMGDPDSAADLFAEALELRRGSPGYAASLNDLAAAEARRGNLKEALKLQKKALELLKTSHGPDHPDAGTALINLAALYERNGRPGDAMNFFSESKHSALNQLERNFAFLTELEKEQFAQNLNVRFNAFRSFILRHHPNKTDAAGHALDIELATKGMILQSGINMRLAILQSGDDHALELFDDWHHIRNIISQQYSMPVAGRRDDLNELERRSEQVEAELAQLSRTFKASREIGNITWRDIQQRLKPGEAAVEFAAFRYHDGRVWTDSTYYTATLITEGDSQPEHIKLFEQRQIDRLLERRGIGDADFVSTLYRTLTATRERVSYGSDLYEMIWKPLEARLNPGDTVYFSPSGSLHQISFAALPTGEKELLSDRYRLYQLSSLSQIPVGSRKEEIQPESIALFGGIDYNLSSDLLLAEAESENRIPVYTRSLPGEVTRGESWEYLPGTLTEIEAIEELAQFAGLQVRSFTGSEATETAYKQLTNEQSPEIMHIATHGFFFPDPQTNPEKEHGLLTDDHQMFRSSDNPLMRSGLLFAGGNRAWRGEQTHEKTDDGILTALEAANAMMANTRLAVLSACETGLGDIRGSEGVFGLQRAFKMAGVDYLLMSLWKVPDNETAEFMTLFYESLFGGNTIPDAFHQAQHEMKTRYRDEPFKWAAFVLVR